ncbi:head maturation protease, ClpP-related [Sandarakinorhabdus sp.]|uniref:head maturation protease, ClpP-related n=1 Tax=Sandarakinorhabdus sp. TaxID=1916663 RepID=UPI0035616E64
MDPIVETLASDVASAGVLATAPGRVAVRVDAASNTAELYLSGEVGFDITAVGVLAALRQVPPSASIVVRINSGGGSAFEGIAIFNALRRAPQSKTVVVEALAASAASLIAMAGDRIEMPSNSFLMIHRAWAMAIGNRTVMDEMRALLDRVDGVMAETYMQRTKQGAAQIIEAMDKETWFSAAEAVAFGLADAVHEPMAVAASFDPARFKNVPAPLLAMVAGLGVSTVPAVVPFNPPAASAALQELQMPDPVIVPAVAPAPVIAALVVPPVASVHDLQSLATRARLPAEWVVAQQIAGASIEAARDAALEAVASARAAPTITITRDEGDTARAAVGAAFDWLFARRTPFPAIAAERDIGTRPMDIARACVELAGGQTRGKQPSDIARAAMNLGGHAIKGMATTSDFPGLLGTNVSKRLLGAYENASEARNFLRFCFERRVPDFKTVRTVEIGMAPALLAVPEGAEVRMGVMGEASQTYTLVTYGRRQVLSYQALVNDDLGAFDRLPSAWANAAANLEASIVWGLFNANAALADTIAWFHASHANTAAGTMTVASLGAGRAGIRAQTDATGQRLLVTPNVIIVPPQLETDARALLAPQVVPASLATTAVNPWLGAFGEPVVGHFLTDVNDYYVSVGAGSGYEPVEVAYLDGSDAPMVDAFTSDEVLGVTTRCVHNFAAAAVTHRTIYRLTA